MEFIYLNGNRTIISKCVFTNKELQLQDIDVEVPYGVMTLDCGIFLGRRNIRNINLPDTMVNIGDRAFEYCTNLQAINIPSRVQTIPYRAFLNCHSLNHVEFPEGLRTIEPYAFSLCNGIRHLDIPSSVSDISFNAFPNMQITLHHHDIPCTLNMESSQSMEENSVEIDLLKYFFNNPSEKTFNELTKPLYKVPIALAYLKESSFYKDYLKNAFVSSVIYVIDYDDIEGLIKLIDNNLIHPKRIDAAMNYAIRHERHEAVVILMQYKDRIREYRSNFDRFDF